MKDHEILCKYKSHDRRPYSKVSILITVRRRTNLAIK